MIFPDSFKNHILPDQVHILNVCFLVPEMRKEFGGTGGNIAYNLNMLGGDAVPMATVGSDFQPYRDWLKKTGINDKHVVQVNDSFTAQAFITTDIDNNQIINFHPGAMNFAHQNKVADAEGIKMGILAPDGRDAMINHSREFRETGIPFFFDPGQGLPMFGKEELDVFINEASFVIVNDYEAEMLQEKTGVSIEEHAKNLDAMIVTRGGKGSDIHAGGKRFHIPVIKISEAKDPTGCGDAFRAGLLYGLSKNMDWETAGRIGSLIAGIKIEHHGTQNHTVDAASFAARFKENFGYELS